MSRFRHGLLLGTLVCAGMAAFVAVQSAPAQAAARHDKSALLIGIDTYLPPGAKIVRPEDAPAKGRFASGMVFPNLEGPTHDVAAMRALLTSEKFGFPNNDQHIHVLENAAATRKAILAAMQRYLVDEPKQGDTVVLYISSHGSLRVNSLSDGQVYDIDGKPTPLDNTIVPADAYLGAEDILSRDLRRIFNAAAQKGIHLTAIIDACHSGGQARGATDPKLVARSLAYDPRDLKMPPDRNPDGTLVAAPEDRKVNPVLVFSAAQKDQSAEDVQDASPPYGLFTHALVEALEALPAGAPAVDVYRRVLVDMEISGADNQQPALDSTEARKHEPLFGGKAEYGPPRAAIVSVRGNNVVLDIGRVADIGKGSEFTEITATDGVKAVLRVTGYMGANRSQAEVVSPAGAQVRAEDIVECTKWIPRQRSQLSFYAGPANLSLAQIRAAAHVLRAANIRLVKDPSSDAWTHILQWDGANWTLQAHGADIGPGNMKRPPVISLGSTLTAASLSKLLPGDSVVWFDPPLPSELAKQILTNPESTAQLTPDRARAAYIIAGTPTDTGIGYAWYQRGDFDANVQTPPGYGRGCAPDSPYPLRTSWISIDDGLPLSDATADSLNMNAQKLARLNGWLHLESAADDSNPFPYALALKRISDDKLAPDGGKTYRHQKYDFALDGSLDAYTEPRWVYVMGIDCQGNGQLLWPQEGPGGRFPTQNGRMASIPLPDSTIEITRPFGTDTYILLTTSTPLADPGMVLNFSGVVKGGERGVLSPLEQLLQSTSFATRGSRVRTPTDWGIQIVRMHSQPATAPQGKAAGQ